MPRSADPTSTLLRRPRPARRARRSLHGRSRQPVPAARHDQAPELPGQPGSRQALARDELRRGRRLTAGALSRYARLAEMYVNCSSRTSGCRRRRRRAIRGGAAGDLRQPPPRRLRRQPWPIRRPSRGRRRHTPRGTLYHFFHLGLDRSRGHLCNLEPRCPQNIEVVLERPRREEDAVSVVEIRAQPLIHRPARRDTARSARRRERSRSQPHERGRPCRR